MTFLKDSLEDGSTLCDPIIDNRILLLYLFGVSSILYKKNDETIKKYFPNRKYFRKFVFYTMNTLAWIYYYCIEPILNKADSNFAILVDTWDMFENLTNRRQIRFDSIRFLIFTSILINMLRFSIDDVRLDNWTVNKWGKIVVGSEMIDLVSNLLALIIRTKLGYNAAGGKKDGSDQTNIDFYKIALFIKSLTGFLCIFCNLTYKIFFRKRINFDEKKERMFEIVKEIHEIISEHDKQKEIDELTEIDDSLTLSESTFLDDYREFLLKYKKFSTQKIEELEDLIQVSRKIRN